MWLRFLEPYTSLAAPPSAARAARRGPRAPGSTRRTVHRWRVTGDWFSQRSRSAPGQEMGERVPTRFVSQYTLRAAHLDLGGVDLDLAVENDVNRNSAAPRRIWRLTRRGSNRPARSRDAVAVAAGETYLHNRSGARTSSRSYALHGSALAALGDARPPARRHFAGLIVLESERIPSAHLSTNLKRYARWGLECDFHFEISVAWSSSSDMSAL